MYDHKNDKVLSSKMKSIEKKRTQGKNAYANQNVLTVNKSYHTIVKNKNKNKKNELKAYDSLINTLFMSQTDNYLTTSTNKKTNNEIMTTERENLKNKRNLQKKKTLDNIKTINIKNPKTQKVTNLATTTKKVLKKTHSNYKIKINLNNNFNNIITSNNNDLTLKSSIVTSTNDKIDDNSKNINTNKNPHNNLGEKKKISINIIRKNSLDLKQKKS